MDRLYIYSFLIITLFVSSFPAVASVKVIYGSDDRAEPYESSVKFQKLAKATAAMVPSSKLKVLNSYEYTLGGRQLADNGVCSHEKFSKQPVVANCSGFLVLKDTLVTAGHCITSQADCDKYKWVFNYKVTYSSQSSVTVDKSDVYECKNIVQRKLESSTQADFAVIKLKKKVSGVTPLKFRTSGKPSKSSKLVVIGHPSGLPTKIAPNGRIRKVGNVFLTASLDTYGGNSGSAVFNQSTGVIEGILVRGDTDYIRSSGSNCRISNVLGQNSGRGEDVTLITTISSIRNIDQSNSTNGDTVQSSPQEEPEEPVKPSIPWWWRWFRYY